MIFSVFWSWGENSCLGNFWLMPTYFKMFAFFWIADVWRQKSASGNMQYDERNVNTRKLYCVNELGRFETRTEEARMSDDQTTWRRWLYPECTFKAYRKACPAPWRLIDLGGGCWICWWIPCAANSLDAIVIDPCSQVFAIVITDRIGSHCRKHRKINIVSGAFDYKARLNAWIVFPAKLNGTIFPTISRRFKCGGQIARRCKRVGIGDDNGDGGWACCRTIVIGDG